MKKADYQAILIVVGVAILTVMVSMVIFSNYSNDEPFDLMTLDYDFYVAEGINFNLDKDILHFGGSTAGAKLSRAINITSKRSARVEISWEGPGSISVDRNNFFVNADLPEPVKFTLIIPDGLQEGNYTGKLFFAFYEK